MGCAGLKMIPFYSPILLISLIVFLIGFSHADEGDFMKPLHLLDHMPESDLAKRGQDFSQLDFRAEDSFIWSNPINNGSQLALANYTLYTEHDHERVLSVERFRPMLKALQCGPQMILAFSSRENFEYAIRAWDWINEDETNSFIMIADDPGCGPDDQRVPYFIYNADYDEDRSIAYLYGVEKGWKDLQSFDLEFGTTSMPSQDASLQKRATFEWDKEWRLDIDSNLNGNVFNVDHKYGALKLDCLDCGISGDFVASLKIVVRWLVPEDVVFGVRPDGVRADLGLSLDSRIEKPPVPISLSYSKSIFQKALGPGFNLGEFGKVGFFFKIKVGISTDGHQEDSVIKFGSEAKLKDSAKAKISFAGEEKSTFSGWTPQLGWKPVSVTGDWAARASVFLQWTLGPEISLEKLGIGLEASVVARFPEFAAEIDTFNKKGSGTACEKNGNDGISVDIYAGGSLAVRAGKSGDTAITADLNKVPLIGGNKKRSDELEGHVRLSGTRSKTKRRASLLGAGASPDIGGTDIAKRDPTSLAERALGARVQYVLFSPRGWHLWGGCLNPTNNKTKTSTSTKPTSTSRTTSSAKATTITSKKSSSTTRSSSTATPTSTSSRRSSSTTRTTSTPTTTSTSTQRSSSTTRSSPTATSTSTSSRRSSSTTRTTSTPTTTSTSTQRSSSTTRTTSTPTTTSTSSRRSSSTTSTTRSSSTSSS